MTRQALQRFAATWGNLVAVGAAVAFGFIAALTLAGWMRLPEQVERQGDAIVANSEDIAALKRGARQDSLRLARIECVVVALARQTDPIERCGL
jgi:hypothetical protein